MSTAPIGVCLRPEYDDYSLERLAEYARLAEASGFHSVWLAESWGLDAIALLAHLGAQTRRVVLGTAVVNVFSRTPALLAMAAVTLADLYRGRFILGLGASTRALVEGWHGLAFDRPVARLRDAIHIIRQAASGAEVRYRGAVVSAAGGYRLRLQPKEAAPPIYVASLGPASMRLAGELADGWLPYLLPLRGLPEATATMRAHARQAGRREDAVRIAPLVLTAVAEDAAAARDAARKHIAFYLGAMGPHYRGFVARFGFQADVERVHRAWADGQREKACEHVTDTLLDEVALAGTPGACRDRLAAFRAAGADLPILFFPGTCSHQMVELALRTMTAPTAAAAAAPRP